MKNHEDYMREAIALSIESVEDGGGPFGAVVVDLNTGEIIGRGKNRVTLYSDPTAHGEIEAIRDATKKTNRTELSNCSLYTSAEPCPGCLTEIVFNTGIKEVYYGNTAADANVISFADEDNWNTLGTNATEMMEKMGGKLVQILRDEAQEAFVFWQNKEDKDPYYQK